MNISGKTAAGIVAALAFSPAIVSAGNTFVYGNVSSWTVRTDPEQSYRCFAEVLYEGGTSIRIGYNSEQGDLYLSVTDPAWSGIRTGSAQGTTISFDDEESVHFDGTGIGMSSGGTSAGVSVTIPQSARPAFLRDFMARHTMSIGLDGAEPLDLSLAGSQRATMLLDECQASMTEQSSPGK